MSHRSSFLAVVFTFVASLAPLSAQEPTVIFDMDAARHKPPAVEGNKAPLGTIEVVDGKFGKACRFTFAPESRGAFFTASVRPTADWDQAAGISFWVKGDGSKSWGGLEMIDSSNYGLRYAYCFPIDSTQWRKITVRWQDLVPETPGAPLVDPKNGYAPSKFGNLWFGKWWYWGSYPAHSYAIDQIALEPTIPADATDHTPALAGTPRLLEKLKARKPVTIVTMGDSLSDKRHWANREVLWSEALVEQLRKKYGGEVKLVNPALGGTQLSQNLILMPRWLDEAPRPDLVVVWFGFNDFDGGMRRAHWEEMLRLAVDRIRRMTQGQSEVLLATTCPAITRWTEMEELAEGVRAVAKEKKTGLADVAAAFHRSGEDAAVRATLFAWDRVHLGKAGHLLTARIVLEAIEK